MCTIYSSIYKPIRVILSIFAGIPSSTAVTRGAASSKDMHGSTKQLESAQVGYKRDL